MKLAGEETMQGRLSLINHMLAHSFAICVLGGGAIAVGLVTRAFIEADVFSAGFFTIMLALVSYVLTFALGMVLGAFPGWMIFGNIARFLQGAPFAIGDTLCILKGKHKGKIYRVYEVWPERRQVRLDLGASERERTEDVFNDWEVCKVKQTQEIEGG